MTSKNTIEKLISSSKALFNKGFFGIYHGSISSKIEHDTFIVNTKNTIFNTVNSNNFLKLKMLEDSFSWNFASIEANVHDEIYNLIHEAKFIACGMPPYTTAFALDHDEIIFHDYYGQKTFDTLKVYDPGNFKTWYARNAIEIPHYIKEQKNNIMIIKGIGVYIYDRDIDEMIKKIAILENSCRILGLKKSFV